jgi:SWI/SNF-related matrix-associated actin-dependent regulator of chromatin subfamily D
MLIDFDQEVFPNQKSVEWKRSHTFTDCEGFSFVKKITPATYVPPKADNYDFLNGTGVQAKPNAKVLLFMKHDPPIYHLSPELKKVMLGNSEQQLNIGDDKQNTLGPAMSLNVILSSVWKYILVNKLLDQNEKKVIVCDQALKEVFETERMTFADIIQKVKEHLIAPAPIEIDFNMNGDATQMKEIPVDIEVQIPTMQRTAVEELLDDKPLKEVEDQNAFILKAVETIKEHKKKRDFMLAFSSDPVPFIHQIIHSQTRDLLIANNRKEMEESRFSNFYKREWVNEAVTRTEIAINIIIPF